MAQIIQERSLVGRVGRGTLVYSLANALQRGVMFILLPFYTSVLSPADFGVLAVITGLVGILGVLFTLSLNGAVTRYYFEFGDDAYRLSRFWGTIVTFIVIVSVVSAALLLCVGEMFLGGVLGDVAFWPYAALGIVTAVFQPLVQIHLAVLQTRERMREYATTAFAQFVITVALTVSLVLYVGFDARGPLLANLIAAVAMFAWAAIRMRKEIVVCLELRYLTEGLRYSLPLVPHMATGQIQATFDRVALNGLIGSAAAGVYHVGYLLGGVVTLLADSISRAYVPVVTSALKNGSQEALSETRNVGLLVVVLLLVAAFGIGTFAPEIVRLFSDATYSGAGSIVPVIAFGFAAGGVYYVFVNILFFDLAGTRLVYLGTLIGCAVNVVLNLSLVPHIGIRGAALSLLISQVATTVTVATLARRLESISWPYARIAGVFVIGLVSTAWLGPSLLVGHPSIVLGIVKLVLVAIYFAFVSYVLLGSAGYPIRQLRELLK